MLYEFTLTLRPRLYKYTAQEQFDYVYNTLRSILDKYKCSMIAELTGENNIHMHAKIELKDFKERNNLINKLRSYHMTFGKKTITQLINEPKYDAYMLKDIAITMQVIKQPVVMDAFDLFTKIYKPYIEQYEE